MKIKHCITLSTALLAASLLTSCATAKVDSWTDPAFSGRAIGETMVLAVSEADATRHQFEDLFVRNLSGIGVNAVASHTLMPADRPLTETEIDQALKRVPAGSVIVTKITDKKKQVEVVPPVTYHDPFDYYSFSYSHMNSPGYTRNYTEVYLEMNLYDVATRKLVWTGQTKVTDYKSSEKNMELVVEGIIKDLQKQGLAPSSN